MKQQPPLGQRREVAQEIRVPVPATKLSLPNSKSSSSFVKPGQQNLSDAGGGKEDEFSTNPKPSQGSVIHGDGFDTDTECFDSSTFTSAVISTEDQRAIAPETNTVGMRNATHTRKTLNTSHIASANVDHDPKGELEVAVDDKGMEGDDESYDESGDEDNSEEGDRDSQEEITTSADILHDLNSPAFLQYCQQMSSSTKGIDYQKVLYSPSARNIVMRCATNLNAPEINLYSSSNQSTGIASGESLQQGLRESLLRAPSVSKQRISAKSPQNGMRSLNDATSFQSPAAVLQAMQTSRTEPRLLTSPALRIHHEPHSDLTNNPKNDSGSSSRGLMPPLASPKGTNQAKQTHHHVRRDSKASASPITFTEMTDDDDDLSFTDKQPVGEKHARGAGSKFRKRVGDLDHNLDKLFGMTYDQLRNEPFDVAPQALYPALPANIEPGALVEKLQCLAQSKDSSKNEQRRVFLASLSMEDYEQCGEVMIQKFTQIVSKFVAARQQKRKLMTIFEEEIAKREQRVRGKVEAFEKHFSRLKRGGEDVVNQKMDL